MKAIVQLILVWSSITRADTSTCGERNKEWNTCKTAADCTLVADGCGSVRIAASKQHAAEVAKYYACKQNKAECSAVPVESPTAILKCEAYTVTFPGAKAPTVPSCVRLNDIVGMAIINNDRARIEAAVLEAKDVDMSLSHIHETPLSLSAMNSKTDLVRWLLSKGAKINFQTKNGYSALMFAAMSRASDKKSIVNTVTLLLKSGADKTLRNSRGESAMDLAAQVKNAEVIQLLK